MRPKTFDETSALEAAMRQFWEAGFEGSSMQSLVDRMGISRQSLYDTYGNKRRLFESALCRYREEVIEPRIRALADPARTPGRAIRDHLEVLSEGAEGMPVGCLVVRSAAELPVDDPDIGGELAQSVREILEALETRIREGQETGEFRSPLPAGELAAAVLAWSMGLNVLRRFPERGASLRPSVDAMMALLAAPGGA